MASSIISYPDPDCMGDFDPIRGDGLRSIFAVIFDSSMTSDILGDFDPIRGDGLRSNEVTFVVVDS